MNSKVKRELFQILISLSVILIGYLFVKKTESRSILDQKEKNENKVFVKVLESEYETLKLRQDIHVEFNLVQDSIKKDVFTIIGRVYNSSINNSYKNIELILFCYDRIGEIKDEEKFLIRDNLRQKSNIDFTKNIILLSKCKEIDVYINNADKRN